MSEFDTLAGTLEAVWNRLQQGVADRTSVARHPVLATVGAGGEARIVVLRGADRGAGVLRVHTDLRSGKVAELRAEPRATLLVWDAAAQFQIRLRVRVAVISGGEALADWALVPDRARGVYGADPSPGVPIPQPGAATPGPNAQAFAVLACHIRQIETLHLGRDVHRRALFEGECSTWLAP